VPAGLAALLAVTGARDARAERVPEIAVGPATLDAAQRVDARPAEVTVYSDRARVRRRGRGHLAGAPASGATVVRFPDLPGGGWTDTVRVAATGARVLRVEARPVERERRTIEQASKLLDELDAIDDRMAELDDVIGTDDWEVRLLSEVAPAAPVPEDKREGRKGLAVDVGGWARVLDFLAARGDVGRTRLQHAREDRRQLEEKREKLRADVTKLNQGGFSDRLVEVLAVLDGAAGAAVELELEYFVPGARWRPAYDLHFAPGRGQLRLETAAVVEQATGEDWDGVALALSTATPGRGIDAPELLTWTLGEKSEFVPELRARTTPPPLPSPLPVAASARVDAAREALAGSVRQRITLVAEGGSSLAASRSREKTDRITAAMEAEAPVQRKVLTSRHFSAPSRAAGASAAASAAPPPPAMAPAPEPAPMPVAVADSASESVQSAEEAESAPVAKRFYARVSAAPVTRVPLALFDQPPPSRPSFSDPSLPAVSAGGLDYVYQAPTPATVPSSGQQTRIPLAVQTFRAAAFHQATPALAATAFLRARVRNDGKRPLLRGPANIFSDGELVSQGDIQTTGPGGEIELPLGADQDIRLVRQVVPATRTTGLIMKTDETIYDVTIQVGNYKKQAVTIEVADQLPRSARDKVDVQFSGIDPPAQGPPDADGVVRWRVDVAAGATRTLRLHYTITRPKGWQLFQR